MGFLHRVFIALFTVLAALVALQCSAEISRLSWQRSVDVQRVQLIRENIENYGRICRDGQILPNLLAIGAQKSATTSMFQDLRSTLVLRQDINCSRRVNFWDCKEPHGFDRHGQWGKRSFAEKKELYLHLWGKCAEHDPKRVVADFTPDYAWFPTAASRISEFYGSQKQKLVLVFSLREPKKRLVSAYYAGIVGGWVQRKASIGEHVDEFRTEFEQRGHELWTSLEAMYKFRTVFQSLYFVHLENYLREFHPKQFVVFPGGEYTYHRGDVAANPVLVELRRRLGRDVLWPEGVRADRKSNHNAHRPPEEELTRQQIDFLDSVFGPLNQRLAELLAAKAAEGMSLVGYSPSGVGGADEQGVASWLKRGWDF